MMFEKSGRTFNMNSYINLQGQIRNVLDWRYRFRDENKVDSKGNVREFICQTCHNDLKKGVLPAQAVANGLEVPAVPEALKGLTRLEVRCIALRIPFMNIRALRKGGLGKISGPCINVPVSLEPIAEVLPRVPQDTELILLKFKRMLLSKSNYLCDYIRPQKVMCALRWLKENNSLYRDVIIDEDWFQKFECDDLYQEVCEDSEIGKAEEQSVQVELVCEEKEDGESNVGEEVEENKEIMGDNSNGEDNMKVECNNMDREDVLEDGCGAEVDDDKVDSDEDEANMKEAQEEEDRRAEVRIGSSVTCIGIKIWMKLCFVLLLERILFQSTC